MFCKFGKLRVTLLCTFALCACAARAATLNVGPGQTYATIQSAINAAQDFDTVLVAPGTYTENIDLLGKWITVTSSGGASVTIIDGSAKSAPAVTIEQGGTHTALQGAPTFSGFTVQNGGTGAATKPTGGIYVNLSNGTISNNYLVNNHCAGLWVVMLETPPTVQNNQVIGTTDNYDCPVGGGSGIVVGHANTGCVNCKSIPIPITGNTIKNNLQGGHETQGGGGITILGGVSGAQIQNNTIYGNATAGIGGGIWLGISNAEVVQNLVYYNGAACGGAEIATERTQYTAGIGTLLLANNTLYTGIYSGFSSPPTGTCTSQSGNGSQLLFADEGSLTYPTVVVNNIVSDEATPGAPIIACAFANDAAAGQRDTPVFDHNLFYNDGFPFIVDTASCTDPNALLTDLTGNPQFVYTQAFDFELKPTSPAIDAGNTSALPLDNYSIYFSVNTATDFAGNPRLADATGKGYATIDMGAYEFAGTPDTQQTNVSLGATNVNGEFFLLTAAGGSSISLKAVVASPVGGATGCVGPVSLLEDGTAVASANIVAYSNTATFNNVFLAPGTHHFAASYSGQSPCSTSVSVPIIYIVSNYAPSLTLTSSPNPSLLGQSVTFTVTIASGDPAQSGPIILTDGTTLLATLTPNAAGVATYTTSALALGTHPITASYPGDATHGAASASLTQTVLAQLPTTTTLQIVQTSPTAGTPVQLIATVTPVTPIASPQPTGTVTFYQIFPLTPLVLLLGTAQVGASGVASVTLNTLPAGTEDITCTYSGDQTFALSRCPPATITIAPAAPPDFTLSGPSAITFLTTTSDASPLTLASAGGFAANVALSCSATIPQYVCSIAPTSVPLPANGSALATLTLQWVGLAQADRGGGASAVLAALLPLSLLSLFVARKRRRLLGLLCLAALASAISACGSAAYPTIFGSYPVTVTATGTNAGASTPTTHTLNATAQIVQ